MIEQNATGETQKMGDNWDHGSGAHGSFHKNGREDGERDVPVMANKTIDWRPACDCFPTGIEPTPRPGLVLDPFSGSGRTGIQAARLGHDFVGIDLNPDYVEMSQRLLHEEAPLFS